jgi:hypothetical protein
MKHNKKRLLIAGILILFVTWLSFKVYKFLTGGFGAGSYPYAETYMLPASEGEIIAAIRELQKDHLLQKPPGIVDNISVRDTGSSYPDYWRLIDFYYLDSNQVIHTWTRPNDSTSTTFAFYGIDDKVINQDYWYLSNKLKLRKFRKEIFEPLEAKVEENKKISHKVSQ